MRNIRTGDIDLIRELNENIVFRNLMRRQPISRVGLSEVSNLSFSTVTKIITQFEERELIVEDSIGESSGGRRPTLLKINPHGGYVVGINLDVIETSIGLLDLEGNLRNLMKIPTEIEKKDSKEVLENIANAVKDLIEDFHAETGFKERVLGIGISCAGGVDLINGTLIESANLGWRDIPIARLIKEFTGLETFIEDIPKSMAIGEHWFGNAKDTDNLVWIYIGGGLGIGVVINGSVYRGVTGNPGEFCHVSVVRNGSLCNCGNRGCLETYVGEVPVLKRVREALKRGTTTNITNMLTNIDNLKLTHIFQSAKEGDIFAKEILYEMIYYTSLAVSISITAYDPGVIVLGGPVIEEGGEEFFEQIKTGAQDKMIKEERYIDLRVKQSILGENAPVISAATLVYQELFKLSPVYV
jgi:predicted NBD/HSP70 family sugar kinase